MLNGIGLYPCAAHGLWVWNPPILNVMIVKVRTEILTRKVVNGGLGIDVHLARTGFLPHPTSSCWRS